MLIKQPILRVISEDLQTSMKAIHVFPHHPIPSLRTLVYSL